MAEYQPSQDGIEGQAHDDRPSGPLQRRWLYSRSSARIGPGTGDTLLSILTDVPL